MEFYVRPADSEFEDEIDFFEGTNGTKYMYSIEYDGETVRIKDTVGRGLPLDTSDIPAICKMLQRIYNYEKNMEGMSEFLYKTLVSGADNEPTTWSIRINTLYWYSIRP